jgi:hypothetical protein
MDHLLIESIVINRGLSLVAKLKDFYKGKTKNGFFLFFTFQQIPLNFYSFDSNESRK